MTPIADFFLLSKEQILQKADKLRSEGKHAKAAELLASGLKNGAEDFDLLIALASAHLADKKGRDAVLALKNALVLAPARGNELLELAERFFYSEGRLPEMGDLAFEMNLGRRNFEDAVKIVKTLSDRDIDVMYARYNKSKESLEHYKGPAKPAGTLARDMTTYYGLALLSERKGWLLQAMTILEEILALSQDEKNNIMAAAAQLASFHPGDREAMIKQGDILIKLGKKDRALELYTEAAKGGAVEQVINKLENALGREPGNIEFLSLSARLLLQKQDAGKALIHIKKLLELDHQHMDNWLAQLRETIKVDPALTEAHMLLGDAALRIDKYDLAMSGYARVAELAPQRLEEVLSRYRKILEKAPGNFEAATKIIDAYISAGQTGRAIAAIREIVGRDITMVDLALEKLDDILKTKLDQPEALDYLAECYLLRQDRFKAAVIYRYLSGMGKEQAEKALSGLQKMVAQDPSDIALMSALLEVLVNNQRYKEGIFLGQELVKRHAASWPEYMPILERASAQAGFEFNGSLADICDNLGKKGQSHQAVDFIKAAALAESGQYQKSADILAEQLKKKETAELARKTLQEMAEKFPKASALHLALAENYQDQGDWDAMSSALLKAIRFDKTAVSKVAAKLNQLLEKRPENKELQMLQLELLFQERLLDKAFKKAGDIISRWPDKSSARAHLRMGQIYLEKGELTKSSGSLIKASELDSDISPESAEALKRLLEIDPASLPGHYAQAKVFIHQRAFDRAVDELMAVEEKDPRLAESIANDLKTIQKLEPTNVKALVAEAQMDIVLKKPEAAVAALSQVMDMAPDNFEAVEKLYLKLISLESNNPRINLAFAKAHIIKGNITKAAELIGAAVAADQKLYEPAVSLLKLAHDKDPKNISGLFLMANIYRLRSSYAQSIEILKNIIALDESQAESVVLELQAVVSSAPDQLEARYLLAGLYRQQNFFENAVKEYQAIFKSHPGDRDKIQEKLKEIVAQNPDLVPAVILSSRILAEQGKLTEAVSGYMKACELDKGFRPTAAGEIEKILAQEPQSSEIAEALGTLYFELGKFAQAREILSRAAVTIKDNERKTRVLFFLAESHLALKDDVKADEAMDQVRRMMPDANEVYKALRRFKSRKMQVELDKAYQALQEAPDDQFCKLDLADKLIIVEKYEAAINLLNFKPLDEETSNRRVLVLARAFYGRREAVTAIELLRQIPLEGHPYNSFQLKISYLLARCYEAIGNYAEGLAVYRNIYMDQIDYRDVKSRLEWCAEAAVMRELEHRGAVLEWSANN